MRYIDDRQVYRVSAYDSAWRRWIPLQEVRTHGGITAVKAHISRYFDWYNIGCMDPAQRQFIILRVSDSECNKFYLRGDNLQLRFAKAEELEAVFAPIPCEFWCIMTGRNGKKYICSAKI